MDAYTTGVGYAENKVDAELIHRLGRLQGRRRASTAKTSVSTLKEALRLLHRHGEDDGYDGNYGKKKEIERRKRREESVRQKRERRKRREVW